VTESRTAVGRVRMALAIPVVALLVVVADGPTGAVALRADEITVHGTVEIIVVDDWEADPVEIDISGGGLGDVPQPTEVAVEVDGGLLPVPDAQAEGLVSGQDVVVTLDAPAGMPTDTAVAEALAGSGAVEVVDVAAGAAATGDLAATLAPTSPAGPHSLTVLPVYWISPDVTTDELATMATESADYWTATSGGTMTFAAPVVEDWVEIPSPGGCTSDDEAIALYNTALAAHGLTDPLPATNEHVVVYFPPADCGGWLGLASLDDGRIWINGEPSAEVLAHEMGHNLGIMHANTIQCVYGGAVVPFGGSCYAQEYGDYADLMGGVRYLPPGNLNGFFVDNLDLSGAIESSSTSVVETVLAPLGDVGETRSVRIPWVGSDSSFYVDYRPNQGRDTRKPTWAGVQVHVGLVGLGIDPVSFLLAMNPGAVAVSTVPMPQGARYTFPDSYYTLKVDRVTPDGASIRVIPPGRFGDVPTNHMFYVEIAWMTAMGITRGTWLPNGSFGYDPVAPVTRMAMAAFLYRAAGSPAFTPPPTSPFPDVPTSHMFYKEIAWMLDQGITTGTVLPNGSFGYDPTAAVSRQAMAAFLYRAAGEPEFTPPEEEPFDDISPSAPFRDEIMWMFVAGISTGNVWPGGTYYLPLDPVSRMAMAAFIFRNDDYLRQMASP
jgi:hypothetical protein